MQPRLPPSTLSGTELTRRAQPAPGPRLRLRCAQGKTLLILEGFAPFVALCHGIGALLPHVAQGRLELGNQGIGVGVLRHCRRHRHGGRNGREASV